MDRIRFGLIGLNFGRHIVHAVTHGPAKDVIELKTVCDRDHNRADAIGDRHHVAATYDVDELLADDSLEAVGVFTGPVGRADMIRRIIRAGKHVMTTKPFELNPDSALDVLEEARHLGKVVHLNSPTPLLPPNLKQVLTWRDQLNLGRPIACRRDVWANYREKADGGWYDDPQLCPVAPMFRLGIYMINDLIRLMGDVESVQVTQSRIFTGRPTPDNAQLTLHFTSGAIGTIFASFCVDDAMPYGNSMVLNYERGTIYQNSAPCLSDTADTIGMSVVTPGSNGKPAIQNAAIRRGGESGSYQWDAFSRAIRGEKLDGEVTPREVVAGLRVVNAMSRAAASGKTERV